MVPLRSQPRCPVASLTRVQTIRAVDWSPNGVAVRIIDQRRLPGAFVERDLATLDEVCDAIRTLAVRGAPAIGVAGAMGMVVALSPFAARTARPISRACRDPLRAAIRATRPTAVNLPWAVERMLCCGRERRLAERRRAARRPRCASRRSDDAYATRIAQCASASATHGLPLIPDGARVLTHCNAGALATAGIGTALAPIYLAARSGRRVEVFADETRPLLAGQSPDVVGAGAGGHSRDRHRRQHGGVAHARRPNRSVHRRVRIASPATATSRTRSARYGVAVAAHHHGIPMYVAAPRRRSTRRRLTAKPSRSSSGAPTRSGAASAR